MLSFLFILLVVITITVYGAFSWGYVAYKFYYWFVFPLWEGLPQYQITQFVGILLFVNVLTHKEYPQISEEFKDMRLTYLSMFFGPWLTLFLGWVIYGLYF